MKKLIWVLVAVAVVGIAGYLLATRVCDSRFNRCFSNPKCTHDCRETGPTGALIGFPTVQNNSGSASSRARQ